MSYYAINSETLTSMADIVRAKTDTTDQKTIEDIKEWMEESSSKPVTHTVNFYNGETLIESVTVPDGGTAFCRADLSAVKASAPEGQYLSHFYPIPTNVKSDMDVFAQFSVPDYEHTIITDSLEEIVASIKDGSVGMKYRIGQYVVVQLSNTLTSNIQLTQIYPDFLPAVSGDVIMTRWITQELYEAEKFIFNSQVLFQLTNVYEELNSYFDNVWPDIIKSNVKTRIYTILPSSARMSIKKSKVILDRVSAPDSNELYGDDTLIFKKSDNASRKKYVINYQQATVSYTDYITCSFYMTFKGLFNLNYYDYVEGFNGDGYKKDIASSDIKKYIYYYPIAFSM